MFFLENKGKRLRAYKRIHWQSRNLAAACLTPECPDTPSSPQKCGKRRSKSKAINWWLKSFASPHCNLPGSDHCRSWLVLLLPHYFSPLRVSAASQHELGAAWGRTFPIHLHVALGIMRSESHVISCHSCLLCENCDTSEICMRECHLCTPGSFHLLYLLWDF